MNDTPTHELLRAFLRDCEASCPACGYALRNCQSDRCPECGAKLELTIGRAASEVSKMWVFAVSGWAVTALLSVMVLIGYFESLPYMMTASFGLPGFGLANPGVVEGWMQMILVTLVSTLTVGVTVWLVASRQSIHRWPNKRQTLAGLGGLLAPLVLLALFFAMSLLMV